MSVYEYNARSIRGEDVPLSRFRGEVLLIVNVASRCGFTPQYRELEALYRAHHHQGFEVLGFPCDQFGHQEPGEDADIERFCTLNFEVTFPLFSKICVNGPEEHALYGYLKDRRPGVLGSKAIKWNFTKFLVDRSGEPVKRYAPTDTPARIATAIEAALRQPRDGERPDV
jgi:glutathione peroxidase